MKQVIVVRTDLGMSKGKMIAQACHASLCSYGKVLVKSNWAYLCKIWLEEGQTKIILKVDSQEELEAIELSCKQKNIAYYLVHDAGHTELEPGTITCLGIGPDQDHIINEITGKLKLL